MYGYTKRLRTNKLKGPMKDRVITDEEFFASYNPDQYSGQNPAVAVDVVVVGPDLRVCLKRRVNPPSHQKLALPGTFLIRPETLENACRRAIERYVPEVDFKSVHVEQMHVFDGPGRDIRKQVVSIAHIVPVQDPHPEWPELQGNVLLEDLAFDHRTILLHAIWYLKANIYNPDLMRHFLPGRFPIADYRSIVGDILLMSMNPSNFRGRVEGKIVRAVDQQGHGKRTLYSFN